MWDVKFEEWLPIPGFVGLYDASNWGRVRSLARMKMNPHGNLVPLEGRVLKNVLNKDGYFQVKLTNDGKASSRLVHRLVLETFVGPCPDGHQACHFPDRDRLNNRLDNLRWGTVQNNHDDMKAHGTRVSVRGERSGTSKLKEWQVKEILVLLAESKETRMSQQKIASRYGVQQYAVSAILLRKTWKHVPRS